MMLSAPRTWADTTRYANALEDIIFLLNNYLPPDSGITHKEVVSEVIGIIELRAGYQFIKSFQAVEEPLPISDVRDSTGGTHGNE